MVKGDHVRFGTAWYQGSGCELIRQVRSTSLIWYLHVVLQSSPPPSPREHAHNKHISHVAGSYRSSSEAKCDNNGQSRRFPYAFGPHLHKKRRKASKIQVLRRSGLCPPGRSGYAPAPIPSLLFPFLSIFFFLGRIPGTSALVCGSKGDNYLF